MIKNLLIFSLAFLFSCTNTKEEESLNFKADKENVVSGEMLNISYNINPEIVALKAALVNNDNRFIEIYNTQKANGVFTIRRIFSNLDKTNYNRYNRIQLLGINKFDQIVLSDSVNINLDPSIVINSLCHTEDCNILTGNVIGGLPQTLKVSSFGFKATKYIYLVNQKKEPVEIIHDYNSPTDFDVLNNIIFPEPAENESYYITSIMVFARDNEGNEIQNIIPVKVVRPIEIRYDGQFKLAQTFEPVPVSGCMTGAIDNRIEYNETKSETRDNSIEVSINRNWSNSVGLSVSQELTEGIQISQSIGNSYSSTNEQSESTENGWETSRSISNSNEFNWSTSNGESWEYSNSTTNGNSQTNETQNEINGSVTVGVEGEGSIPLLGKIGGNVSTTGGVRRGWNNSNTSSNEKTNGYSVAGNTEKQQSFGSVQSNETTNNINGSYIVGKSFSNSVESSEEKSNTRVWDMSNGTSKENVVSVGNEESISKSQTLSSTVTTSLNYSIFLPRDRKGIFYRQTNRWIRETKIITYDQNGVPNLSGKMIANEWNWAVSISMGTTCEEISIPKMEDVTCYIEPCF